MVDKKIIIGKRRAEAEERNKGLLTPKQERKPVEGFKDNFLLRMFPLVMPRKESRVDPFPSSVSAKASDCKHT
jgi:hypothetical protein